MVQAAPPEWERWVDLGSGGGFPGLTVAILCPRREVILVESDTRKAEFLRQAAIAAGVSPVIVPLRVEDADLPAADVISARALAPLSRLMTLATSALGPETVCVFPKGAGWRAEIAAAQRTWRFSFEAIPSRTSPEAAVLRITDIAPL